MKRLTWSLFPMVLVLGGTTACSHFGQKDDGGAYRDSSLSNPNPAPSKLSPPEQAVNASGTPSVLDTTYLASQADYHFTMGETLSFEGQSQKAIEEFKTVLVYDPKSVHVRLRLAAEYIRLSMMTEAIEQAEAAVQLDAHNIDARMLLGGLYSGLKMYDEAHTQFAQILDIDPSHAEAAIYLGALLAEQKQFDESIHYFEKLAKNPHFKETEKAFYYIGRVRAEQGDGHLIEAEKALTKALSIRAEYPEATLALAMLLHAQNKDKAMVTLLKSYQDKFGPEHDMARQLARYYLEQEDFDRALTQLEAVDSFERDNLNIKIQIALILIEQKKYEQSATRLEDVLQLAPESDKVRYYLGAVYEELHHFDLAITHYQKIPAASTYFAESVVHTAHMMKLQGHLDQATMVLESAIKEQDELPQLYAYYATLLDEGKAYKKAVAMLGNAVDKFPSNTQLRFFLGTMQDRIGNTNDSIAEMNKVIEQDANHVQALNYLAYTYAELGRNLEDATKLAAHAMQLQPEDGYILDTVGWVHFKKGEMEEAIKFLEAAHKAKNDESIIAEHLGDAYLRYQMWQKAQKMYQRAAELEHDSDHGQKLQEKLTNVQSQLQSVNANRSPAGAGVGGGGAAAGAAAGDGEAGATAPKQ